ncbi:MAG: MFS transporter [Lachnospiraceae bacterium]
MKSNRNIFLRCCYGYAVSGMAVLVVGAILPSIMREAGLTYTSAGAMLSMMAVGNLLASLFFPAMTGILGKRLSITLTASLVPISLFLLSLLPSVSVIYILLFAAGVARGSITIINNTTVNIISNNSSKALNLLHFSFAVGAFLSPFLTSTMIAVGFGWRSILYLIIVLCTTSAVSYATMDYRTELENNSPGKTSEKPRADYSFLKQPMFYCIGFILFFYLGTENCINGWFVTYLQNTGIMSETYATNMVSVTWLVIMLGRLVNASLSRKYNKADLIFMNALGSCCFFFLLIGSSHLAAVTFALLGMGFFLSGIYPICIAAGGQYMKGSTMGMSCLTAISAMGGILTPQLVGSAADRIGIVAAIGLLSVNAVMVVVLAFINFKKRY